MSEILTDDEHEALLDHSWKVTRRFCIMFSRPPKPPYNKGLRITPFNIWSGGQCKTRPVAWARAFCGLTLRCTVGYCYVAKDRGTWTVYPDGIPTDRSVQQLSYPLIARYLGGHHTTFVRAIKRIKNHHQELAARVLDTRANGTTLATEVAWLAALEEKWAEEARVRLSATNALNEAPVDLGCDEWQAPVPVVPIDSRPVAG